MQTLTQRRSVPVDAAKTAAIFGTLLIHASAAGGFAGAPGSFGGTAALFWNCLLRSAVPVFFLCSGALLLPPEKEVTVRRVWTKYIPRILAALLFWAAAYEGVELLRGWLRENGYLIKQKGSSYNMPTQKSMELGLFKIKETCVTHSDGHTSINRTPKVTGKGQGYLLNKILGRKVEQIELEEKAE